MAGKSGAYNAVVWLRPWLQLEELTRIDADGRPHSTADAGNRRLFLSA